MRSITIGLVCLGTWTAAFGQQYLRFQWYSTRDGLSNNFVFNVVEDKQ